MDQTLFYTINSLAHPPFLDTLMYGLDLIVNYGIIFIPIILINISSKSRDRRRYAKLSLISLIMTTLIVNLILKNIIARDRPGILLEDVYYIKRIPDGYSFPSGHTATIFAIATMSFLVLRKKFDSILIYMLAILTAFSRIYAGHHYPSDVVFGALFGILISFITIKIYKFYSENLNTNDRR